MCHLKTFLIIALFIPSVIIMSQEETKKVLPKMNQVRTPKVNVKHISLDLRFDWQKKQAYGTASISLAPFESTDVIKLDAAMLTINSVTISDGTSLKYAYDGSDKNDNLKITLDRIYNAGENVKVKIDYHTNWVNSIDPANLWGSYGKGIRFYGPTLNDPARPREIWSVGDPESNRYWYPCYDSPNNLLTTEFTATVDKGLTAISNGRLEETIDNPDGTRTFHWIMDTPHANHLTSFVVGEYVDVQQIYEDIELHNYGYPNEKASLVASTVRLPDMMKFFSEKTGVKYPYTSYSQVFVQEIPGGVDNITLSTITENMIDDEPTHADFLYLWDGQEAQTLAGQWFGSYVTPVDWSHVWLNEGFSRYFDELYSEYKNGHEEFLLWNRAYDHSAYLFDWNSGIRHPIVTQNYESAETMIRGDNYSFIRGAMVLHMLRKELGEENWWKAIRHYLQTYGNKLVSTADFQKAVEESTGENLDWFFDQWIYKMGHPVFTVKQKYDKSKKQLILSVRQTQKSDPNDEYPQTEFFKGNMEIEIEGRIEKVMMEAKGENVFTFQAPAKPKLVNFDYESTWIKELKFEKSMDEILYQVENDKDAAAKSWAMSELVKIGKDEKTSNEDKEKVYAAFRNVALSNSYWRTKLAAVSQLQSMLAPFWETKPVKLDDATVNMLLTFIKNERSWCRSTAIGFLGMTRDPKYTDLYLGYLEDESFRVINSAATSLGKTKSPKAFDALSKLVNKPSMKSQSLICALNGLKELGDARGYDIAFNSLSDTKLSRWRLPTPPVWDYRIVAAQTIAFLGRSSNAFPIVFERFKQTIDEDDLNGALNNTLIIITLADPRGQEAFDILISKYKEDEIVMEAVLQYEQQFQEAIKTE